MAWILVARAGSDEPCVFTWAPASAHDARRGLFLLETEAGAGGGVPDADARVLATGLRANMSRDSRIEVPAGETRYFRLCYGYREYPLTLYEGWNLISLACEPPDPAAGDILVNGDGTPVAVAGRFWGWGPEGVYTVGVELHALRGYWVYVFLAPELTSIVAWARGVPVSDRDYPLDPGPGWCLAGVAAVRAWEENPDIVGLGYNWDAGARWYHAVFPGDMLEPGLGYWFCVTAATMLNPQ